MDFPRARQPVPAHGAQARPVAGQGPSGDPRAPRGDPGTALPARNRGWCGQAAPWPGPAVSPRPPECVHSPIPSPGPSGLSRCPAPPLTLALLLHELQDGDGPGGPLQEPGDRVHHPLHVSLLLLRRHGRGRRGRNGERRARRYGNRRHGAGHARHRDTEGQRRRGRARAGPRELRAARGTVGLKPGGRWSLNAAPGGGCGGIACPASPGLTHTCSIVLKIEQNGTNRDARYPFRGTSQPAASLALGKMGMPWDEAPRNIIPEGPVPSQRSTNSVIIPLSFTVLQDSKGWAYTFGFHNNKYVGDDPGWWKNLLNPYLIMHRELWHCRANANLWSSSYCSSSTYLNLKC